MIKLQKIILAIAFVAAAKAASTGFCGLPSGTEVCGALGAISGAAGGQGANGGAAGGTIVRPAAGPISKISAQTIIAKIQGNAKGYPVKDACSCSRSYVAPAIVPAPKCSGAGASSNSVRAQMAVAQAQITATQNTQTSTSNSGSSNSIVASVPADFVSIINAQSLKNRVCACCNEGRLQFGFETVPVEVKVHSSKGSIGEEDITQVKGTVLELQPMQYVASVQTLDQEALNSLPTQEELILQQAELSAMSGNNAKALKELSYGDIGYGLSQNKEVKFSTTSNVAQQALAQVEAAASCDNPPPVNCADGFVAGGVVFRKVASGNGAPSGQQVSAGNLGALGNIYIPSVNFFRGSSSSSSSSSSNHQQSNVVYSLNG